MRRIAVVGSGQRVVQTALPVLATLSERFELAGVFSRRAKTISARGAAYEVEPLEALDAARMTEIDALYLVVSKPAVPEVLTRLAAAGPSGVDLLIETPVLLPRHMARVGVLRAFRSASVTEDCLTLPLVDAVRACAASGALGRVHTVTLDRSGYAYHGIAMLKALHGTDRVVSARRVPAGEGQWRREYRFAGGARGVVLEPRDDSRGRLLVEGDDAALCDHDRGAPRDLGIEVELDDGVPTAFRAGDARRALSAAEQELMGEPAEGSTPWRWMDGMKRAGFRRLLLELAEGRAAYPALAALDDALVDYHLEKLGRYRSNPVSSAGGLVMGGLARGLEPTWRGWALPAPLA
ncbi:MAG: hypothetical protein VX460_06480 [Planctomycetota bacterium]|nr:hypothetical protein [Planctomycetota bacterium]